MSTPTIDPTDLINPTVGSVESGVSDNLPIIGGVAGALVAVGIVWRLARKMVRA